MKIDRTLKIETGKYAQPLVDDYTIITSQIQAKLRLITPDTFSEGLAMQVRDDIDALTMRMSYLAVKWLKRSVPQVYGEAQTLTIKNATIAGYRKSIDANHAGNIARRQERTLVFLNDIAISVRSFTSRYINTIRDAIQSLKDIPAITQEINFENAVEDIVAETIMEKQGVWFAKRKILDFLFDTVANASFVNINGRNYDIRYYADLVARSELAKAFTDGTKATLEEFGDDLVEFSKHANPCDICAEFEGNIYSLSGKSDTYPKLPDDAEIPVHPNCGHALLPVSAFGGN